MFSLIRPFGWLNANFIAPALSNLYANCPADKPQRTYMSVASPTFHTISIQCCGDVLDFGDSRTQVVDIPPQSCGKYMNIQIATERTDQPRSFFTHTHFLYNLPVYESRTASLFNNSSSDNVMPYCAPAGISH